MQGQAIKKLLSIFIVSVVLSLFIEIETLDYLIEKIIFSSSSIMVGLTIAVIGIFMGNINSLYLSLLDIFNNTKSISDEDKGRIIQKLNGIKQELKENMIFTFISFVLILILFFTKEINLPFVSWNEWISYKYLSKEFLSNLIILFLNFSIILAVYDSINAAFRLSDALKLTKTDSN